MSSRMFTVLRSSFSLRLSTALFALGFAGVSYASPPGMVGGAPPAVVPLLLDGSRFEELQVADPAAGINLVEAPEANNLGDANLSYPLEVPPGRLGIQPFLEATYSSSAGNGWLGVGWDLAVPAIAVDTRWGVPRYRASHETETYLLEGRQLTPLAHRGDPVPRSGGDRVFHTRIEGAFDRIVRHGPGPEDCWWEITDTNGTVYSYGGRSVAGGFEAAAVLTDDPDTNGGNVFIWALREIRDTHGNTVLFDYERARSTGLAQGTEYGHDLYLKSIRYTGYQGDPGPYSVTFLRDGVGAAPRPDAVIDALGGFKRVTAELLRRIEVSFEDTVIRSYDFAYVTGAFEKTLLRSITQRGPNGAEFHTHTFDYYDDVSAGGAYQGFGAQQTWNTGDDGLGEPLRGKVSSGSVSSGVSDDGGASIYGGFNPWIPDKFGSAGVSVGGHWSDAKGLLELVDVDGDNLPDKIFEDGGSLFYRPNTSGPRADPAAVTFGDRAGLPGLRTISNEFSSTFCFGPEVHVGAQVLNSNAWTWSDQTAYLADANGDGLIDLVDVDSGQVQFNHRGPGGSPVFDPDSNLTPVPVVPGNVATGGILGEYLACRDSMQLCRTDGDCQGVGEPCVPLAEVLTDNYPLVDTVRRWVAPWDGRVSISGEAALAGAPGCDQYAAADGVRLAIQHNDEELWSARILPDEGPASPRDVSQVQVRAGDRLYFRAQSVQNGACDEVAWDPVIVYRNGRALTDVNLLDPYRYSVSEDFVLAGRRGARVWMPADGTVRLESDFRKAGATSDDVVVQLFYGADKDDPGRILLEQPVAWDQTGDFPQSLDFDVEAGGWVLLRVQTDSPIDFTRISWVPKVFYTSAPTLGTVIDDDGNYLLQLNPPYDIDAYPFDSLSSPQEPWVAPSTGTVTATSAILSLFPFPFEPCPDGTVAFTVKRRGELVAKGLVAVEGCLARNVSVTFEVTKGEELFFDYSVFSTELSGQLPHGAYSVGVAYDPGSIDPHAHGLLSFALQGILHRSGDPGLLFALPYRGWSVFGYNGNRDRAERPIDQAVLDSYDSQGYDHGSSYDPRKEPAHPFMPRPVTSIWLGPDDRTWAGAWTMSPSRLGNDDIRVPRSGDLALGPVVKRQSTSFQSVLGGGLFFAGYSGTLTAWTASEVDYLDMNGDLFPDVVSGGHVQYTSPRGTLEAARTSVGGFTEDEVRRTGIESENFGLGADATHTFGNAQGKAGASSGHSPKGKAGKGAVKSAKNSANGAQKEEMGISVGIGLEFGSGDFDVEHDFTDVNGDGLSDLVMRSGGELQVALNLGYRFGAFETWGNGALSASSSSEVSIEPGLGFNKGDFSVSGGISFSDVSAEAAEELMDINGDGLPDRVLYGGGAIQAGINTGSGFVQPVSWSAGPGVTSSAVGLGGGVYFTVAIGPLCLAGCYIIINPGGDYSRNITRQLSDLRDVDGDGCADLVETDRDDRLTVSLNRTGRTNLLAAVSRPLGGTISLEYQRDGNTYEMPESRWVLSRVTVNDGQPGDGVDSQTTAFEYAGGYSDRWEREFYGYATVVATLLDAAGMPYRSVSRTYGTTGYYTRGLLLGEATADGAGRKQLETRQTWFLRDVETGGELADPGDDLATVFPELRRTDRLFYEGESAPVKTTSVLYEHALQEAAPGLRWSNLVRILDLADEGPGDDVQLDIGYFTDTAAYIVGKPASLRYSSRGRELRRRAMTLEPGTGDVKQVSEFLADGTAAPTEYTHDGFGNATSVTFPPNLRGQRYAVTYGYDDGVFTYRTRIADSFGHVSTARYDLSHGTPLSETDINGNTIEQGYDGFGRLLFATGPYESGFGLETVRYVYHHDAAAPWAMARRVDRLDPAGDPIDSVFFVDGLARVTQTKHDASVHQDGSVAARVMVVSGASEYDFAGRTVTQRHPVTEPVGTPGVPSTAIDGVEPSVTTWDVADRPTSLTLPDGSVTRYEFGFGRDRRGTERFRTRAIDARGVAREIFRDVRGLVVSVKEGSGTGGAREAWTSYDYDPLRSLTTVVDDRGNVVEAGYDNLGRRVMLSSPDGGRTETRYDLASNVVERITENLRLSGGRILYDYDYFDLTAISYPVHPENNVAISWGPPGAPDNAAGRVTSIADESGVEQLRYGLLGAVAERTRTVASETQGQSPDSPEVYSTSFSHDTWGRLVLLTYPDGEVLTHRYDSGGLLRELSGVKGENRYWYVRRLEYDKFLDRAFVLYGNGVTTSFGYNPQNRCLELVRSGPGPGWGGLFQDLRLACDRVGNVIRARNLAAIDSPRWLGGATDYSFTYDEFNRLTGAVGLFERPPRKAERYSVAVEYDSIHNIASLERKHQVVQPSGQAVTRHKTSDDLRYQYRGAGAHAPDRVGAAKVEWDANGNQVLSKAPGRDGRRTLDWDEENRLQAISLNGHTISYKYDLAGKRVVARGPQGETVSVNRYLTVRNREVGLKHFFAGDTRVATKLMKQDRPGAKRKGRMPLEKDLYFYHADHLGTTTFVTDAQGELFEHREYFPFGGTFIDESSNTRRAPYLFAAQELDEESGLYWFGSRYYDPEAALWLSADPTLEDSFPGGGGAGSPPAGGGVFESRNLNLFGYAGQNPTSNVGSDRPPFSRPGTSDSLLLHSPGMGWMPSPAGLPPISDPHLGLPWWMATESGAQVSEWWASPVRWGVSQLTQDQAQSVEEAPATGALRFEWGFNKKTMKELRQAMHSRAKKPAVEGGAGAEGGVQQKLLKVAAPGPAQGADHDIGAKPQRRRRAASAP